MSEATETRQDVYDAVQEIGTAMTFTTFARSGNTTTGAVTETPTEYANIKASPPERRLYYETGSNIPVERYRITLPSQGLAFTPSRDDEVQLGTTNYRIVRVDPIQLQDLVVAYELWCDSVGDD